MKDSSDIELVREAQSGNVNAFECLVKRHYPGVRTELLCFLKHDADAEDVAQDVFLVAYQKLNRLGPPFNFSAWVRQIARNRARNLLTRSQRHVILESSQMDRLCRQQPQTDDPLTNARLTDDAVESVMRALSSLSAPLRETSRLSYLQQCSQRQIADRLHIPIGTVKRRLWESRNRIRQEVTKMSRKGRVAVPMTLAPVIKITDLPDQKLSVRSQGPGLYFSSVLAVGHSETCRFFDYPGGILTQTVRTTVTRAVRALGRDCIEVLIEHFDCEPPEAPLLDYFERMEDSLRWVIRVTADDGFPATRFMGDEEEVFPVVFATGEHKEYIGRAVDLIIGDRHWGRCLAVWWSWEDGTPVEDFYTTDGRQILHRRFVGETAPVSRNYEFSRLDTDNHILFRGTEFRLWYDTVLDPDITR